MSYFNNSLPRSSRAWLFGGVALAISLVATGASAQVHLLKPDYEFKKPKAEISPFDLPAGPVGLPSAPISSGAVVISFEGISQYDVASVQRNFIPPDTIMAAGKTQLVEFVNGGFAVFDKTNGARTFTSDTAFWNNKAGLTGTPNGDQRVMYNANAGRWIALSFGPNTKDIQIAVSTTSDALGAWQGTSFQGFAPLAVGARTLADYPTLAMDRNAVYIGTNDFGAATVGGATNFRGTTLNVIPIGDLFNAVAPIATGNVQFRTPYDPAASNDFTRGFAIQGVNSNKVSTTGNIIAASINDFGLTRYDVLNAGTAGAVRTATASTTIGTDYTFNDPARQPSAAIPANRRIIDSFGDQISSSAWEVGGRIYSVHTVTDNGSAFTSVRYTVLDAATNAVLDEGSIKANGYDYYQGSLAVNEFGQVVVGYNRSGLEQADLDGDGFSDGNITLLARSFWTDSTGKLVPVGDELKLKVSLTDDYHNGSVFGQVAAGRQRWADYSAVSLDPEDSSLFWVSGTFAREYNNAAGGHPGGTGGSRWGTYIAAIDFDRVPEPPSWALIILGLSLSSAMVRRRRSQVTSAKVTA